MRTETAIPNHTRSILLVEDDTDDQFFFAEALSEIRNASLCDIASNGREALDKLKAMAPLPDLIFMDINMPLMNGIECLSAIMDGARTRHIPVVILSTDTGQREFALQMGAKAFLKKPSDSGVLRSQLEQMINPQQNSIL